MFGAAKPPTLGRARAAGGWSHCCERPTSFAPAPMANMTSVVLGDRDTIRAGLAVCREDSAALHAMREAQLHTTASANHGCTPKRRRRPISLLVSL
jgi:hypothetical protein